MAIGTMKLSRTEAGFVHNQADREGDDLDSMAVAEQEIRAETVEILLRLFKRGGDFTCTKVQPRRENIKTPQNAKIADGFFLVSGYISMLQFINHCTVPELEARNGMSPGMLRNGAFIFFVNQPLDRKQFAPRYTTQWSAGVSPRDLDRVGANYHTSYPASKSPIFQASIFQNNPATGQLIATLNYGDTFNWPPPADDRGTT